jgi:hypothetical protein
LSKLTMWIGPLDGAARNAVSCSFVGLIPIFAVYVQLPMSATPNTHFPGSVDQAPNKFK